MTAWSVAVVPAPPLALVEAGEVLERLGSSAVLTLDGSCVTAFEVEVQGTDAGEALEQVRALWQRTGQEDLVVLHARRA